MVERVPTTLQVKELVLKFCIGNATAADWIRRGIPKLYLPPTIGPVVDTVDFENLPSIRERVLKGAGNDGVFLGLDPPRAFVQLCDSDYKRAVQHVITDTKRVHSGLIKINADKLANARDAAMYALQWIVDIRDRGLAREIVIAAKEILNEARERDAMYADLHKREESVVATQRSTLSSDQHARLLKAVENE